MELETGGSINKSNVVEADITDAFADDAARGDFIILSVNENQFIQAADEGDEIFAVEYRDSYGQQFQAKIGMVKAVAEAAFKDYLRKGTAWRDSHQWRPLT